MVKEPRLPVEHGKRTAYHKLASERLHGMRRLWKSVTTIITDEISMVSYQTLNFVHQRLTEIKGTDDTEVLFGGLNVIAVGDFFQLPQMVTTLTLEYWVEFVLDSKLQTISLSV